MFGLTTTVSFDATPVLEATDKAAFRNFGHAAASIRKDAQSTIEKSPVASEAGDPPHTRRGQLPRAITFDADQFGAVIGPRASVVDQAGEAHEFGGEYKAETFDERPFMAPALERGAPRFAASWNMSVGE